MSRRRRRAVSVGVVAASVALPSHVTDAPSTMAAPSPAMVEVPAPEPPATPTPPMPDLSTLTVAQLRALASELGISLGRARTRAAIIAALET